MLRSFHGRAGIAAVVALLVLAPPFAAAQQFTPGQEIEYRDGAAQWAPGTFVRMLPNGNQALIRQAPSQFFPEGFERAYSLTDLRPRQPAAPAAQALRPAPQAAPAPQPKAAVPAVATRVPAVPQGAGLLNQQQVLDYAKQVLGPNPWAQPNRDAAISQIRDYIKSRGVNFQWTLAFDNQLGAIGANAVHITSAIGANYGAHPTLQTYIGNFNLQSQARAAQSVSQQGGRAVVTTTDSAARLGSIRINADRTYVWDVLGDGKVIRGTWREATEDEKQAWEGGPSIWLLNARGGQDYQVRADRQPGWAGWIDIGMGKGRIAVQYGQRTS